MGPLGADDTVADLEARRQEVREQASSTAAEIDLLRAEDEAVASALADLDEWIALVEADIDAAQQAIEVAEDQARMAGGQAEKLAADIAILDDVLADRAVEAYVRPGGNTTEAVLESDDLNDAARRRFLISITHDDIMAVLDDIRVARKDRGEQLAIARRAQETAEVERGGLNEQLTELHLAQEQQHVVQAELETRIGAYQNETAQLEAADDELSELIRQAQLPPPVVTPEPIEAAPEPEATPTVEPEPTPEPSATPAATPEPTGGGSGALQWPIGGPVVSEFGMRVHPIFGDTRMHTGLDIDANSGDPIGAAGSGSVIFAGWQEGYGNVVIIDHGGELSTVYAHMSALGAAVGESVNAGQTVGQVGSTGYSTGPHLHFEVRVDGTAVDPRQYLP
jgi:murein DD-endopeptidase MepM/ murein hydrolase activator NlpD